MYLQNYSIITEENMNTNMTQTPAGSLLYSVPIQSYHYTRNGIINRAIAIFIPERV